MTHTHIYIFIYIYIYILILRAESSLPTSQRHWYHTTPALSCVLREPEGGRDYLVNGNQLIDAAIASLGDDQRDPLRDRHGVRQGAALRAGHGLRLAAGHTRSATHTLYIIYILYIIDIDI
jgi:hypothetical protein